MFNGRLVRRAWGWYWTIIHRGQFKVKLLRFHRNKACSLQYHNLRKELWLFLTGRGWITKDDVHVDVRSGDYMVIPRFTKHKYLAHIPTFVLEVQYGDRCEEEDIVRV